MDKIDTQGMSGPTIPGSTDNIYPHDENGEPILPRAIIRPNRLHTPQMVKELKILINEVLDEREGKSGISYFDTCLLYTSPSPRDKRQSRMPSSA